MQKRNIQKARQHRLRRDVLAKAIKVAASMVLDPMTERLIATEGEDNVQAYKVTKALEEMGYHIVRKTTYGNPLK